MPKATITSIEDLPVMMTLKDVQSFLGVSKATSYRLAAMTSFPTLRIGSSIRVPREALVKWVEKNAETVWE